MRMYCKQQRGSTIIVGVDDQLAAPSRLELVDVLSANKNYHLKKFTGRGIGYAVADRYRIKKSDYHSSKYGVEDSNTGKAWSRKLAIKASASRR
ncbi:hypothetical protein Plhal703r1_c19g0085831 [Plasmopara halstedii]